MRGLPRGRGARAKGATAPSARVECAPSLGGVCARLCYELLLSLLIASSASAVTLDWATVGDPGNACDPSRTGPLLRCRRLRLSHREPRGDECPVRRVPEREGGFRPARALQPDMASRRGRHHAQREPGSYTYSAIPGRENTPVTTCLTSMRSASRTGCTTDRATATRRQAPTRCSGGRPRRATPWWSATPPPRSSSRPTTSGTRRHTTTPGRELLRLPGRHRYVDRLLHAHRHAQPRELRRRRRRLHGCGELHGLAQPQRHLRSGRQCLGVDGHGAGILENGRYGAATSAAPPPVSADRSTSTTIRGTRAAGSAFASRPSPAAASSCSQGIAGAAQPSPGWRRARDEKSRAVGENAHSTWAGTLCPLVAAQAPARPTNEVRPPASVLSPVSRVVSRLTRCISSTSSLRSFSRRRLSSSL